MAPTDRPITPSRILEALNGFQRTAVLKAAIELDVFTAIAEGATDPAGLAERIPASEKGVRALGDYLVTLGLLAWDGAHYALTVESARYLDRASTEYLGGTVAFYASPTLIEAFAGATEAVRRGGSDPAHMDSMVPSHPIWTEYARAMVPLFRRPAEAVAELVAEALPPPGRILDVAAGHGLFGIAIARKFPSASVTAIDWPEVLEVARSQAREGGVEDRFTGVPGNAFDTPLGFGWDVVLLTNFLHHFDPATCETLLRRVAAALRPDGAVVVVEFIPNDDRVTPPAVAQFGMSMLTTTTRGEVYSFSDLSGMLERAGFRSSTLHPLPHTPERAVVALR